MSRSGCTRRSVLAIALILSMSGSSGAQTPKPVAPGQHRPQGVPDCYYAKSYGSFEGRVQAGKITFISVDLTSVSIGAKGIGVSPDSDATAKISMVWDGSGAIGTEGFFEVYPLDWPIGGTPAIKAFKLTVTAGATSVRTTARNNSITRATPLFLRFKTGKVPMVTFLREGEANGTLTCVAVDSARTSRSITLTATLEGIGVALDELMKEADRLRELWAAGRCK